MMEGVDGVTGLTGSGRLWTGKGREMFCPAALRRFATIVRP
jgi:hypothetical protein